VYSSAVGEIIEELRKKVVCDGVLFVPLGPKLDCSDMRLPFCLQCSGQPLEHPSDVGSECGDTARATAPTNNGRRRCHALSQLCSLHNYFDDLNIPGVRLDYVEEMERVVIVLPPPGYGEASYNIRAVYFTSSVDIRNDITSIEIIVSFLISPPLLSR
jgi:hypothetical protein